MLKLNETLTLKLKSKVKNRHKCDEYHGNNGSKYRISETPVKCLSWSHSILTLTMSLAWAFTIVFVGFVYVSGLGRLASRLTESVTVTVSVIIATTERCPNSVLTSIAWPSSRSKVTTHAQWSHFENLSHGSTVGLRDDSSSPSFSNVGRPSSSPSVAIFTGPGRGFPFKNSLE